VHCSVGYLAPPIRRDFTQRLWDILEPDIEIALKLPGVLVVKAQVSSLPLSGLEGWEVDSDVIVKDVRWQVTEEAV